MCLTHQNNREGPQAREPSKCLNGQSYRERLTRGLLIASYKRLEKKTDRAKAPMVEAVHVPVHLVPPESPQTKQLCHLHAQLSLGQSCHRPKRISRLYMQGSLQSCPTICSPVDCGLPGFSVRGFLQARILECSGQYWVPYPPRTLYFLLP